MPGPKVLGLYVLAFIVPFLAAWLAGGFRRGLLALALTGAGGIPGVVYAAFVVRDMQAGTDRAARQTIRMVLALAITLVGALAIAAVVNLVTDLLSARRLTAEVLLPAALSVGGGIGIAVDRVFFAER